MNISLCSRVAATTQRGVPYRSFRRFEPRFASGLFIMLVLAAQTTPAVGRIRDNRLTGQRVDGMHRLCVYGSARDARTARVGLGEPCPYHFAPPEEPGPIPSMAIRIGQRADALGLICVYRLSDRIYSARPGGMGYCPLTPSGDLRPVPDEPEY